MSWRKYNTCGSCGRKNGKHADGCPKDWTQQSE
jgi:hypothetical protein